MAFGCIIKTISGGSKITDKGKMYLLCGHNYFNICDKCKYDEDTLYNMWKNDNLTNDLEYAGWKEHNPHLKC